MLAEARKAARESVVETTHQREATGETALNVLVAEDAPDNRLVIAAYLRQEPHHIDFAENGSEAVAKFTTRPYDLVLMDIQMPVMDGLEATRLIRRWESANDRAPVPIVALTAYALEDDIKRTLEAGCDLHLSKPIKKAVLLDYIHTVADAAAGTNNGKIHFISDGRTANSEAAHADAGCPRNQ